MITRLEFAMTCGLIVLPASGLCAQESRAEPETPQLVDVARPTMRPAGYPFSRPGARLSPAAGPSHPARSTTHA